MRSRVSLTSYINRSQLEQYERDHPEVVAEKLKAAAAYAERERGFDALTLPLIQQSALMQMHESPVSRIVMRRLMIEAGAKPVLSDYRALVQRELARYRTGKRIHELTPSGIVSARKLQTAVCVRLDIHLLLDMGPVGWEQKYQCTCGETYRVRRSETAPGNARRQWAAEHATQEGMSKLVAALRPPVMVEG